MQTRGMRSSLFRQRLAYDTATPSAQEPTAEGRPSGRLWLLAILPYAVARALLVPAAADLTGGFTHDSAYVAIVARNLLAGRGFVNDAHWLVFLNPERLPMPYHNANPLYPLATAGVAAATGKGVAAAGLIVSALSGALLILALALVFSRFFERRWLALGLAFLVAHFPPLFADTLHMLPDTLSLALSVGCLAAVVRLDARWAGFAAGVCLGLAWLARSSAILLVPAAFLYALLAFPWRLALRQFAVMGAVSLVVISPWLWHTAAVWGSPLRSDASFYLVQDYVAAAAYNGDVHRYWHSPVAPPSLLALASEAPRAFASWVARGVPRVLVAMGAYWSAGSVLAVLLLLVPWAYLAAVRPRVLTSRVALAASAYAATATIVFAVRPFTVEPRYLALVTVFFVVGVLLGTVEAWRRRPAGAAGERWAATAVLGCAALFWLAVAPWQIVNQVRRLATPRPARIAQRALFMQARAAAGRDPVVVVLPYFYTYDTHAPSLSIPESDDGFLLDYTRRYGARHILLTDEELAYWRPRWRAVGVPPGVRSVARLPGARLFEVTSRP